MPLKKSRIKDIARIAGVSIGTVDRVIHNRGEVAEKTRLKVERILKDTNYSPNVMAQVLKSKRRFQERGSDHLPSPDDSGIVVRRGEMAAPPPEIGF